MGMIEPEVEILRCKVTHKGKTEFIYFGAGAGGYKYYPEYERFTNGYETIAGAIDAVLEHIEKVEDGDE